MSAPRVALGAVLLTAIVLGAFLLGGATKSTEKAAAADFAPMQVLHSHGDVTAVVPVTIKGHTYPFVVDTGASGSVIDIRAARAIGLEKTGATRKVTGVGGKATAVPIHAENWKVGQVVLPELEIDAVPLKEAAGGGRPIGLLGADVLSRFDSVTLDFRRQRLQLGH